MLPKAKGLSGPFSCLNRARYGIAWGSLGSAKPALMPPKVLSRAHPIRSLHCGFPTDSDEVGHHVGEITKANCWHTTSVEKSTRTIGFRIRQLGQDEQRRHCARYRTCGPRHSRRKRSDQRISNHATHEQFGIGQDLRGHTRHSQPNFGSAHYRHSVLHAT